MYSVSSFSNFLNSFVPKHKEKPQDIFKSKIQSVVVIHQELEKRIPPVLRTIILDYLTGSDMERFVQFEGEYISRDRHYFSAHLSRTIDKDLNFIKIMSVSLERIRKVNESNEINKFISFVEEYPGKLPLSYPDNFSRAQELLRKSGFLTAINWWLIKNNSLDVPGLSAFILDNNDLSDEGKKYFNDVFDCRHRYRRIGPLVEVEDIHSLNSAFNAALINDDLSSMIKNCLMFPVQTVERRNLRRIQERKFFDYCANNDCMDAALLYAVLIKDLNLVKELLDFGKKEKNKEVVGLSTKEKNNFLNKIYQRFRREEKSIQKKPSYINLNSVYSSDALAQSCCDGNKDMVEILLNSGIDPNHKDLLGMTPLHELLRSGIKIPEETSNAILNLLIQYKADVQYECDGLNPLVRAAMLERQSTMEILQKAGAVFKTSSSGESPLLITSKNGCLSSVQMLIKSKANLEERTNYGVTALTAAVWYNYSKVAEELIHAKAEVNVREDVQKNTPLMVAALKGNITILNLLIENKANLFDENIVRWTPLAAAMDSNNSACIHAIVTAMLKEKDSISKIQRNLTLPNISFNSSILKILIDGKVDINQLGPNGGTLLMQAVVNRNMTSIESLINSKADVNAKGKGIVTALFLAATQGFEKEAKYLITRGADVNADCSGELLHVLCGEYCAKLLNQKEMVSLLIDSRANVNHQDINGGTPLTYALQCSPTLISSLIKLKADVNSAYNNGASPLHVAVQKNNVENVDELIFSKADVNHVTNDTKISSLYLAAANGLRTIVSHLIDNRADLNVVDSKGLSPLDVASRFGKTSVVRLLVESYPNVSIEQLSKAAYMADKNGHMETVNELKEMIALRQDKKLD